MSAAITSASPRQGPGIVTQADLARHWKVSSTTAKKICLARGVQDHMSDHWHGGSKVVEASRATRRRLRRLGLPCRSRVVNGAHGPIVYLRTLNQQEFEAARNVVAAAVSDFSGVEVPLSKTVLKVPTVAISWTRAA